MATSSFYNTIKIETEEELDNFLKILDNSKPVIIERKVYCELVTDKNEIQQLLKNSIQTKSKNCY